MTVLLLLIALITPGLAQSNSYCPTPSPSGQSYNDFLTCPFINIISNNAYNLDNTCHNYFPINDTKGSYLAYFRGVIEDGSPDGRGSSYIVDVRSDNIWSYSSPYCSFIQKVISVGQFVIGIRQIISGECADLIHPVVVGYPCPQYGSASDLPLIRKVLSDNGVGCSDLTVLPRRYPFNCPTLQSTNTRSTVNCPEQCCRSGKPGY